LKLTREMPGSEVRFRQQRAFRLENIAGIARRR
jgi:hypothetical protein